MKSQYRRFFAPACGVFLAAAAFLLAPAENASAQTARQLVDVDVKLAQDRSLEFTTHIETTPLTAGAVQSLSSYRTSVTANQTLEIVEAFTRKADGRIVPVDRSQIATQDGAVGPLISFTDIKYKQIPFRDLSVGDTWVLTLRYKESEHFIPGQVSYRYLIPPSPVERQYDIKFSAPEAAHISHFERDFAYEETRADGTVTRHWSGQFKASALSEGDIANPGALFPTVQFGTFSSYENLAAESFKPAAPKSAVTPAIQKLADEIAAGRTDARSQAEAIFEWVSQNVRYVAVFFGTGRFVPNDAETVISRRFGDCKDHAALLTALLSAKGIESERVLINIGADYELPPQAPIQAFNHVLVYIPALDLYADPTSPFAPFGKLPKADMDKPVVRASDKGEMIARTPAGAADENVSRVESKLVIAADGSAKGETLTEATGEEAQILRAFVSRTEIAGQGAELLKLTKPLGLSRDAALIAPSSRDHAEPYRIKTSWSIEKPVQLVEKGWRPIYGVSPVNTGAAHFFGRFDRTTRITPIQCRPGRVIHTLTVELPEGVELKSTPKPVVKSMQYYNYAREWRFSGRTLVVRTELSSTTPARVCSPDLINAISEALEADREAFNPLLKFMRSSS